MFFSSSFFKYDASMNHYTKWIDVSNEIYNSFYNIMTTCYALCTQVILQKSPVNNNMLDWLTQSDHSWFWCVCFYGHIKCSIWVYIFLTLTHSFLAWRCWGCCCRINLYITTFKVRAKKGGKIMNIENKVTRMQTRLIRNLKVVCIFFFAVVCLFEHVLR